MPPQTSPSAMPSLQSLYPALIRPIIAPDFCQPLLADAITYLDPLIEDTTIFTAPQRIREIGVEVDSIVRSLRRANQSFSASTTMGEVLARARERRKAFDEEMKREEEEALKTFKEGLRRTVESR
ncbi:hypothetical protein C7212DRAFT_348678 [Tuber magnatum]|uniref:Uncharacterized protein n=1 Tax=Tuber magnatum TaxID=42249 RepID=A0A317SB65_9PEZI|nr:hypothetical protein C7212DRAFT_348678 [Tuber magnatum]